MVEETDGLGNVGFGEGEVYGHAWDKNEIKSEVEFPIIMLATHI